MSVKRTVRKLTDDNETEYVRDVIDLAFGGCEWSQHGRTGYMVRYPGERSFVRRPRLFSPDDAMYLAARIAPWNRKGLPAGEYQIAITMEGAFGWYFEFIHRKDGTRYSGTGRDLQHAIFEAAIAWAEGGNRVTY